MIHEMVWIYPDPMESRKDNINFSVIGPGVLIIHEDKSGFVKSKQFTTSICSCICRDV